MIRSHIPISVSLEIAELALDALVDSSRKSRWGYHFPKFVMDQYNPRRAFRLFGGSDWITEARDIIRRDKRGENRKAFRDADKLLGPNAMIFATEANGLIRSFGTYRRAVIAIPDDKILSSIFDIYEQGNYSSPRASAYVVKKIPDAIHFTDEKLMQAWIDPLNNV